VTKRLIIACGFLAALPFAASASRLISCSSCDPTVVVLTSLNGTGALDVALDSTDALQEFEFENDTGAVINSLEFDATIQSGLNVSNVLANFQCAQLDVNNNPVPGFFQSCTVTYNTTTGELSYLFAGTGPPNGPNFNINFGDWQNEQAGIPSCPAGEPPSYCNGGPDTDRGLFALEFAGFQAGSPASADYTDPNSPPSFMGSYTAIPEPSYVLLLVSGLFFLWFARRRKVAQ